MRKSIVVRDEAVVSGPVRERGGPPGHEGQTLVVFPGALGDFICFLPTLHALRERSRTEGRDLAIVVQAALLPLAVRPGLADEGRPIEGAALSRLFVTEEPVRESLLGDGRVHDVFSWFASAQQVVRRNLAAQAGGRLVCGSFALPPGFAGHAAEHFLAGAGLPASAALNGTHLPLRPDERDHARTFWRRHGLDGRRVLALHRGAGSPTKRWDDARFAVVASWWGARGGRVLEISGPADPHEALRPDHAMARSLAIGDVAALLERATLFMGADSGVSHLAGAVGARGVVVFGPTRARAWRPLGGALVALKSTEAPGPGAPACRVSAGRVVRALAVLRRAAS